MAIKTRCNKTRGNETRCNETKCKALTRRKTKRNKGPARILLHRQMRRGLPRETR